MRIASREILRGPYLDDIPTRISSKLLNILEGQSLTRFLYIDQLITDSYNRHLRTIDFRKTIGGRV